VLAVNSGQAVYQVSSGGPVWSLPLAITTVGLALVSYLFALFA
jgi:hypothetical protein